MTTPSSGGPERRFEYVGKYRVSIDIGDSGTLYLAADKNTTVVGFTTTAASALLIAFYRVVGAPKPDTYVLQATLPDDPDGRVSGNFLAVTRSDDYAYAVLWASRHEAQEFNCQMGADRSLRILSVPYDRYVLAAGKPPGSGNITLFMPPKGSIWDNATWRLHVINEWNASTMANADLRHVILRDRALGNISFAGANLTSASLYGCTMPGANFTRATCTRTGFTSAQVQGADFTGATFAGAYLGGLQAQQLKYPNGDFSGADFGGAPLSFAGATLTGTTFNKVALAGADFSGATLDDAKFVETTLTGAKFSKAKLLRTVLTSANATGAVFSEADLTGARLDKAILKTTKFDKATLIDTNLSAETLQDDNADGVDFTAAKLFGVTLDRRSLLRSTFSTTPAFYETPVTDKSRGASFKGAKVPIALFALDWTKLDLDAATLVGALPASLVGFKADWARFPRQYDLSKRVLTGASFRNAVLVEVKFTEATADGEQPPDFSGANLSQAMMSKVALSSVKFTGATMHGINLSLSRLVLADFKAAHLDSTAGLIADLSYCDLMNADFTGAFLGNDNESAGANLSYVKLWGTKASLSGATLTGAQFNGAYLVALDFQNVQGHAMRAASFSGACLVNSKFKGTSLPGVTFTGACLQGVDFTDAKLPGAKMTTAAIATVKGKLTLVGLDGPPFVLYEPTIIATEATTSSTVCPSSDNGPCAGDKWKNAAAPMLKWTYAQRPGS